MSIKYLEDHTQTPETKPLDIGLLSISRLKMLSEDDLRKLKGRLDAILPKTMLKDLNLEEEAVRQLIAAKTLQEETLNDCECPANQKAQVMNTTAAAIQSLVKMQIDLKRDEQLKRMEAALLDSLKLLPEDARKAYLDAYEEMLVGIC